MNIEIQVLNENNFSDYEFVTTLDRDKPCYCSWWHIKPESIEKYDSEKKTNPQKFRNCILSKIQNGFHVGVLAYEDNKPMAWISVGPINQFYWAWKRTISLGEKSEKTAGIMCYERIEDHWLSNSEASRSIYYKSLKAVNKS